jgi:hypothetical protein
MSLMASGREVLRAVGVESQFESHCFITRTCAIPGVIA